jgi:hypothetical protein|tara:strand:- start:992 stop:1357 length:366 start_codon:yes stop_codon:yes gene_type:complete
MVSDHSPSISHQPFHNAEEAVAHPPNMYSQKAEQIARLLDLKGEDYNSPDSFFVQLAKAWSGLLGVELTPSQCCAMMVVFKSCRIINNPEHEDSADDLVGYSLIMTELVKLVEDDQGWKTK